MSYFSRIILNDPNVPGSPIKTEDGHLSVIPHAHGDSSTIHFHVDNLTTGTYKYILVDRSDLTNYHHLYENELHMEWIEIEVDSDNTGEYFVSWGFLDNVDASGGDRYVIDHISGSKTAGNSIHIHKNFGIHGPVMDPNKVTTHNISVADTSYQTDVNLPSTLDPTSANTPSGTGDIVVEATIISGSVNLAITFQYHSHSPTH